MFLESFRITGIAVLEIFILGAIGYFLVKKNILGEAGLDALSRLTIEITLPAMIFCQLIKDFSFKLYPDWWVFPLLSVGITLLGLGVGGIFSWFISAGEQRHQFLSLVTFQNSGYLPLALVAALLPQEQLSQIFIYLFLFLLGFNIVIFSFGIYLLSFSKTNKFALGSLFSPPVIATLISLAALFFGLNRFLPEFIFRPLKMIGGCTLPLAIFVVGGNLAQIRLQNINKKAILLMSLAKLVILPAIGLFLIVKLRLPQLIGLLILIELAVPSATFLSVFIRQYKKEDLLISQGIFFGHILSIITIPIFLSLYFALVMLR
ncbi:MAG: AEC family transporter [bacterium]